MNESYNHWLLNKSRKIEQTIKPLSSAVPIPTRRSAKLISSLKTGGTFFYVPGVARLEGNDRSNIIIKKKPIKNRANFISMAPALRNGPGAGGWNSGVLMLVAGYLSRDALVLG